MTLPQIVNAREDSVISIFKDIILVDSTGLPVNGAANPTITVDINLLDLISNTGIKLCEVDMTWVADYEVWTIPASEIYSGSNPPDRRKFFGKVTENADTVGMREFNISEFSIDSGIVERLGYEVFADGSEQSSIKWKTGDSGDNGYNARTYGYGLIPSLSPNKVYRRGKIERVIEPS